MYTPIIRNRQSEVLAIQTLDAESKTSCTPLLDLAAPTKKDDQAVVETYVERNIGRMEKALRGFEHAFVESSELDPALRIGGRKHPIVEAARAVKSAGCTPIAVTGLHRDEAHNKAALRVRDDVGQGLICLRLDATDIGTATQSSKNIHSFLASRSVNAAEVVLLLDLQSVYRESAESLAVQVTRFLAQVAKTQWGGIIVAGYGVPDQLSEAVAVREQGYIPRVEQDVYLRVAKAHSLDRLWFGDYTTLSPTQVELDWRLMARVMSPKAVYALVDSWFVVRGGPFSTHADGYGQYHDIAAEIVALEEFSGEDYSYGDKYIHDCALKVATSGSPRSWITACVNHHITLTAATHQI